MVTLSYLETLPQTLPFRVVAILLLLFFAVLFLQSGWDKVSDRQGNLNWLKGHFGKSPFKNSVPLLLTVLTGMELLSGLGALAAAVWSAFARMEMGGRFPFAVMCFCSLTLLCLFLGQRVAKDYAGAAGIVPYFILSIIAEFYFMFGLFEVD